MLVKALYYIENQETHVWTFPDPRENDKHSFYVLKKDNEYGAKKITPKLIDLFEAAKDGVKDPRIKDHASLLEVCDALHVVRYPSTGQLALPCEGNPAGLECVACKSCKGVGICSHVLTINHMMKMFNVRFQLKSVQTNALKKKAGLMGNPRKAPVPALQREPQVEPDSSDEEAERLHSSAPWAAGQIERAQDTYLECICSVSRAYLVCIQRGSDEASKIHVS